MDTKEKHIVIVSDAWHPQTNGVVRTLDAVSVELKNRGHKVTMITPDQFHHFPKSLSPDSDVDLAMPFYAKEGQKTVWQALKHIKPDHIYISTLEGPLGFFALAHCMMHRESFSAGYHTRFPEMAEKRIEAFAQKFSKRLPLSDEIAGLFSSVAREGAHMLSRALYNRAEAVLVPTKTVQDELQQRGYRNTVLWTRGVDINLFHPNREPHPAMVDLPRPIFLNVGCVAAEKNLEMFLDARLPGTKVIAGDGDELEYYREKYKPNPSIVFLGKKKGEELSQIYASADVFVFPSVSDTFGNVMLEAMASELPVAAFRIPSPVDVIKNPKTGVLSQETTAEGLTAAAMAALKLNGKDAREYVINEHTWTRATDIFAESLYPRKPISSTRGR
jgi:glycosyltransferase involved in cell wall biosynthesis